MNYRKMGRLFVGKMAMLLALMFAACAEEDGSQPITEGGASEESGFAADLENLVVKGRAGNAYPKMLTEGDKSPSVEGTTAYSPRGTVVTLYELDSITLDVTERYYVDTIDNDSGLYAFDGITVLSPYALIEIQDKCITEDCRERGMWYEGLPKMIDSSGTHIDSSESYTVKMTAIVDLRTAQNVNVNSLTSEKVPLVRKYYAEGMSFAEASKKAEQEVLESLGIYEGFEDFEKIGSENSELPFVLGILSIKTFSQGRCDADFFGSLRYLNDPLAHYSAMGGVMEEFYLNKLKMFDYEAGCMAHQYGLGRCDESRENESKEFEVAFGGFYSLVCHANKWKIGYRKIEYENGTMTDARDGKTYKTVTYNWNGMAQTWMADNLNYAGVEKTACYENDPDCELYGRFYAWRSAMNLADSSIEVRWLDYRAEYDEESESYIDVWDTLILDEECSSKLPMNTRILNAFVEVKGGGLTRAADAAYDSAQAYCDEKYSLFGNHLNLSKFIPQSKPVRYQGVCPDGWRIPTNDDWESLFKILKGLYGEGNASMAALLKDEYASGFGFLTPESFITEDPNVPATVWRIGEEYISFATVPDPDSGSESQIIYYTIQGAYSQSVSSYEFSLYPDINSLVSVRCIKND